MQRHDIEIAPQQLCELRVCDAQGDLVFAVDFSERMASLHGVANGIEQGDQRHSAMTVRSTF